MKKMCIVGLWFGGFQALMPLVGYFLGIQFSDKIVSIDHWIAFVLLVIIGANMIKEAFGKDEEEADDSLKFKIMLVLAIATSIDALCIGFVYLNLPIPEALLVFGLIGIVTAVLCFVTVLLSKLVAKALALNRFALK